MQTIAPKPRRVEPRRLRLLACVPIGIAIAAALMLAAGRLGLLGFLLGPQISGELAQARSQEAGVRVLLVGNSFTYYNGMPQMVQGLADSEPGAPRMFVVSYTESGATLEQLSGERRLTQLIAEVPWHTVVLQEQSEMLSFAPQQYERFSLPYAQALSSRITADGGHTALEMTWGYQHGDRQNVPGDTYSGMQERLQEGYDRLGHELNAEVAPVGVAWREALTERPGLNLWADGRHPNRAGSYLTACVLYAVLSGRDPVGNTYTGSLDADDALFYQRVAWNVVGDAALSTTSG